MKTIQHAKMVFSHKEVALMYFPELSPKAASWRLTCWLLRDPALLGELSRAGYIRGQRLFTPLQIAVVRYYIGDPEPVDWTKEPEKPCRRAKS